MGPEILWRRILGFYAQLVTVMRGAKRISFSLFLDLSDLFPSGVDPSDARVAFWTQARLGLAVQPCLTHSWLVPLFPHKAGPLSSCCCPQGRGEAQRTQLYDFLLPQGSLGHTTGWLSPCRGTKEMRCGLGKEFDIYHFLPKIFQSNHYGENPLILILQFNGIFKN